MNVIWDGTPSKPLGRLLFAPEFPRVSDQPQADRVVALPSQSARGTKTGSFDKVREQLPRFNDWFTTLDMAIAAGISREVSASALHGLWRQGEVQKEMRLRGQRGGSVKYRRK